LDAQRTGEFNDEIAAFTLNERFPDLATGEIRVNAREIKNDEGPREDTTMEGLAKLRPVFAAQGSVTAGNSSQTSDGAGALIVVSEKILKQFNLTPLARFVSFAVRGVPPEIMGNRSEGSDSRGVESSRSDAGRYRLDRTQRSVCGAIAGR